jgi:hypothetical protein
MPTYTFRNKVTEEQFEMFMGISAKEKYIAENPDIEQIIVECPMIVSGVNNQAKVPSGFKDVLSKISDAHPQSALAQKHKKKSIKEIKTKEIVKKHVAKMTS